MKVTNKGAGPRGVWGRDGLVMIEAGQSADVDLAPGDHTADDLSFSGNPIVAAPVAKEASVEPKGKAEALKRAEAAEAELDVVRGQLAELRRSAPLVAAAVAGLDPENDEHWTKNGEPAVDAVKATTGGEVTRADIEAAAPEFNRDAATASAAAHA